MKKLKLDLIIVILLLLFCFIPYLNLGGLSVFFANYFIYFYLFGGIFLFFLLVVNNRMLIQRKDLLMLFISLLFCFFGYIQNNVSLGNVLTMICSVLYLYYFRKCSIVDKNVLLLICIITSICYVYISISVVDSFYSNSTYLNPNAVAQVLFFLLIIINHLLSMSNNNKKIMILLSILILVGIYNCESRSVLIFSLFYLFVTFILKKMHSKESSKKKEKIIYWIIVIIGLIVPYILVTMYTNSFTSTFSLFGKNLYSGREKIWIIVLDRLSSVRNIFLGIPTNEYYGAMFTSNLHNIFLTILANYGIIYFFIYFYYLFKNYEILIENRANNIFLYMGIIFVLLVGSMENILFSTEFNFLFCLLFALNLSALNEKDGGFNESNKKELSI